MEKRRKRGRDVRRRTSGEGGKGGGEKNEGGEGGRDRDREGR